MPRNRYDTHAWLLKANARHAVYYSGEMDIVSIRQTKKPLTRQSYTLRVN